MERLVLDEYGEPVSWSDVLIPDEDDGPIEGDPHDEPDFGDPEPDVCQEPLFMGAVCGWPADETGQCVWHREVDDPDRGRDLRLGL